MPPISPVLRSDSGLSVHQCALVVNSVPTPPLSCSFVSFRGQKKSAAFTLVELLIGMSLALIIMGAMLSSFTYLGRGFSRLMGVSFSSSATGQPNLEGQGRRTLATFMQDVSQASGLSVTTTDLLSASQMTLVIPTGTGSKKVTYYYNNSSASVTVYGVSARANSLTRIERSASPVTSLTLHANLLTCTFNYYDNSGNPYTTYVNYLPGIKQIALSATAQAGSATNQTLTPVYQVASPRLLLRNESLLP
jgi:hypothetical protein